MTNSTFCRLPLPMNSLHSHTGRLSVSRKSSLFYLKAFALAHFLVQLLPDCTVCGEKLSDRKGSNL